MEIINANFKRLEKLIFILPQFALFIMMILTTTDAFCRYVFNQPLTGAYELTEQYLMVIVVFMSMSYVQKLKGHIRIDAFTRYLPLKANQLLYIFSLLMGVLLMSAIGYQGLLSTYEAFVENYVATGLIPWPTWLSVIWVPLGSCLFVIRMLLEIIRLLITFGKEPIEDEDVEEAREW